MPLYHIQHKKSTEKFDWKIHENSVLINKILNFKRVFYEKYKTIRKPDFEAEKRKKFIQYCKRQAYKLVE